MELKDKGILHEADQHRFILSKRITELGVDGITRMVVEFMAYDENDIETEGVQPIFHTALKAIPEVAKASYDGATKVRDAYAYLAMDLGIEVELPEDMEDELDWGL